MLITIFAKSIHNLFLPDVLKLLFYCLLAYALGWWTLAWIISSIIGAYIGISGNEGFLLHALGSAGGMVIAWFSFPLLYPLLVGFFDDKIVTTIEREDYPQTLPANPPFWPNILQDALFCVKALCINLLCLPLYFMPLVGVALYYVVNGYLLGTQFFRMAAGRRTSETEAHALQKQMRSLIWMTGIGIMLCSTIPVLNLFAPLLGVASMVHLFHAVHKPAVIILPPV